MNTRDPFNLHRSPAFNILRATASRAAANVTQQVVEAGTQVYETGRKAVEDMSTFSVPKNVPSFTTPQRELENRAWGASGVTARSAASQSTGGVLGGMQDRVGDFFDGSRRDLPMYKDKPYSYAASRRHQPIWKRKRLLTVGGIFVLTMMYFLGFFASDARATKSAKDTWRWMQRPEKSGSKIDWLDRRERVVEAFTLSWDSYARYGWGM
jgi:mannosyl-oligosaccharide alpha-1,2-mannosidase